MGNNEGEYNFLSNNKSCFNDYFFVTLREEDIELIRKWRNEQIDILRQNKEISASEQNQYYKISIKKSFHMNKPRIILFSFLSSNKCIGYGGFVHIDWKKYSAELSFILDTKRIKNIKKYEKEFIIFLKLILKLNKEQIKFKKIFTETYDIRQKHVKVLEEMNFKYKKRNRNFKKIDGELVDSLIHTYTLK